MTDPFDDHEPEYEYDELPILVKAVFAVGVGIFLLGAVSALMQFLQVMMND